jgi:SAM-dependent methyltransferase
MRPELEVSLAGVEVVWICRCARCGFRQVRPRVTGDRLAALYPSDYFDTGAAIGYRDYGRQAYRREREAYFMDRRLRAAGASGSILEVGCALGFLLSGLRTSGWTVEGLDISPFAAYYSRTRFGLAVRSGTLETQAYPDGHFGVVIQKDVLEHVSDPRGHLLETHRVLQRNGLLWVITPNGEANLRPLGQASIDAARNRHDVVPLMDQGHLSFFSHANLTMLFEACGFGCVKARTIGVRRGLRALGRLPGGHRSVPMHERHARPVEPPRAGSSSESDAAFEEVARRIDQAVAGWRSPLRSSAPYGYVHRFFKMLDTLPARTEWGYDFEFLLRRR